MKDFSLLFLRLTFGGLMLISHAVPKIQKIGQTPIKFPDPLGVGNDVSLYLTIFSEGLCSVLLILGLFTRLASLPLIFTMSVATFIVHLSDPLHNKESAILYMAAYIVMLGFGGGQFSLDNWLRPKAKF